MKDKNGKTQQVLLTKDLRAKMAGSKFMKQITRLEKNMTKGYAAAVKAGGKPVSVDGKKITGSQIATRLEQAYFNASPDIGYGQDGKESEAQNDRNPLGNNITYFQAAYGTSDQRQQITTIHEGIHSIPSIGGGRDPSTHGDGFNKAAEGILESGQ